MNDICQQSLKKTHRLYNRSNPWQYHSRRLEQRAVERFLKYRDRYVYKEAEVVRVLKFFSVLNHSPQSGFNLLDWQVFTIANLYGLYRHDGSRLFKFAYVEIAKKNGKSSFAAALVLYEH
jgi:phage terminase large subunit-like protein